MIDAGTTAVITHTTIKVCDAVDLECSSPLSSLVADDPTVTMEIPAGTPAYLRLEGYPSYVPSTLWFDAPLYGDLQTGAIPLFANLLDELFLPPDLYDPSQGRVLVRDHDCAGEVDSGAYYSLGGATGIPFTIVSEIPTFSDPPAPGSRTILPSQISNVPWAGFANVTPGHVTITGTHGPDMQTFGQAEAIVRPGEVTYVEMGPLSHP